MIERARISLAKLYIEAGNITNREISEATGIHPNTVTAYRNGSVQRPDVATVVKLRNFFSQKLGRPVTIDEMVQIDE